MVQQQNTLMKIFKIKDNTWVLVSLLEYIILLPYSRWANYSHLNSAVYEIEVDPEKEQDKSGVSVTLFASIADNDWNMIW